MTYHKNRLTKRVIVLTVEFELIRFYSRLVLTQNFALFDPHSNFQTDRRSWRCWRALTSPYTDERAQLMLLSQSCGFSWLVCWINILSMKCPFLRRSETWKIFRIWVKSTRGRRALWRRRIRPLRRCSIIQLKYWRPTCSLNFASQLYAGGSP